MKLTNSNIDEIPSKDPFKNCKLDRKKYASVLTSIVENYKEGFVLALDNEWGTGKTTFIKMWRQYLEDDEFSTLYFNAWENDFENDVLIALISELSELNKGQGKKFDKVISNAAPFASKLLPVLAKSLTAKYVGDDFAKELINGFTEVTVKELENEIKAYKKRKEGLIEFRRSLQSFVSEITSDKPLVFFIDELDRCRPNYAVKVLEQIKHLFSVENIVFVLSIDKSQLRHAIKGVYNSQHIDANEYLKRFIDVEFSLPEPKIDKYIDYLYKKYEFEKYFEHEFRKRSSEMRRDGQDFTTFLKTLFKIKELRLRQLEKIIIHVKLIVDTSNINSYLFPDNLSYLVYLKHHNPELYNGINNAKYKMQELFSNLEKSIGINTNINVDTKMKYIISEISCMYFNENFISHRTEMFYSKQEDKPILHINTIENNKVYLNAVQNFYNLRHASDLKLGEILDKINLTNSIIK